MTRHSLPLLLAFLSSIQVKGHGYLKTPRSRNLFAFEEIDWEDGGGTSPFPEDCPHCLNRGGTRSQCGLVEGIDGNTQLPWVRNYDVPKNYRGQPMPPNIQETYTEGDVITIEAMVTTHHKGHFVISACPVVPLLDDPSEMDEHLPLRVPTQECFDAYRLNFVSDELYGATPDPNYPERAYLAPALVAEMVDWTNGVGAWYKMKFQLPKGLNGEVVLLQWYYLTANTCKHEGYAEYEFPTSWGSDVERYKQMEDCGKVPPDGAGVPEQFWNCGEVKIERKRGSEATPLIETFYTEAEVVEVVDSSDVEEVVDSPTAVTIEDFDDHVSFLESYYNQPPAAAMDDSDVNSTEANTTEAVVEDEPAETVCADDSYTGYEPNADCTGYIWCAAGVAQTEYECGDGMLYDDQKGSCNWADEVRCGGAHNAGYTGPPVPPTPHPTQKPNPLLDWDRSKMTRPHDKTIIGYYASWQWYDRNGLAAPINMDFTKITRANFAFFQITEDGYIFGTDTWADPITLFGPHDWMQEPGAGHEYCSWDGPGEAPECNGHKYEEGLIYRAHAAGAEVYPSIGGWSLSDPFPAMAANPGARKNFVSQCVALIRNYNFDGIDIDWEYPGYEPHSGTEEDGDNWILLLEDLRAALDELEADTGRHYGITAALPCGPSIIDNQNAEKVGELLTELNLMTYDFHGTWNNLTGVNAPLYDQEDSPEMSVDGCVANWVEGGAPKAKINIGFPFYGRSFLAAKGLYEEHEGGDETTFYEDEGCPQYYNIIKEFSSLTTVRDEQTMTQYAYGKTGMVSYDDPRAICDKTEYAMDHDLNGYIIWELSGDMMADLSTPLLDAANAKLVDPSLDCSTMSDADAMIGKNTINNNQNEGPSLYYPLFDGGNSCVNDGNQPEYYPSSDMFEKIEDCCEKHFSWDPECASNGNASFEANSDVEANELATLLYYPNFDGSGSCIADGKEPSYHPAEDLFENPEDCCEKHFSWNSDCARNSIAAPPVDSLPRYYPKDNLCINTGSPPSYLSGSDMFDNQEDCCKFHFSWNDECIDQVNKDDASLESVSTTTSSSVSTTEATQETTTQTTAAASTQFESAAEPSATPESPRPFNTGDIHSKVTTTIAAESTTTEQLSTEFKTTTSSTVTSIESYSATTSIAAETTSTDILSTTEHSPSMESDSELFASGSFLDADATTFVTTSSTKTSDTPTTTMPSTSTSTTESDVFTDESSQEAEGPSQADAFMSAEQVAVSRPNQMSEADESDKSQATSTLHDMISSAISISQDSVPVQPFYVEMLPLDSGYGLKVNNPKQLEKAVSGYLKSYLMSLDGWSYSNVLIDFELDCKKSDQNMSCEGSGIFGESSTPSKRDFNDLIYSAFAGRRHEDFLEYMYPSYGAGDQSKTEEERMSPFLEQTTEDMTDKQDQERNKVKQAKKEQRTNDDKRAKMEQLMLEKKKQQMRGTLDSLRGKNRMLRSRI